MIRQDAREKLRKAREELYSSGLSDFDYAMLWQRVMGYGDLATDDERSAYYKLANEINTVRKGHTDMARKRKTTKRKTTRRRVKKTRKAGLQTFKDLQLRLALKKHGKPTIKRFTLK